MQNPSADSRDYSPEPIELRSVYAAVFAIRTRAIVLKRNCLPEGIRSVKLDPSSSRTSTQTEPDGFNGPTN